MNFSNDELIKTVDLIKKQVSQGGKMDSKTMDVVSSATICANTHIAQMNIALGYDPRGYRFESYYEYYFRKYFSNFQLLLILKLTFLYKWFEYYIFEL